MTEKLSDMAIVPSKENSFENIPSIKAKTLRINLNPNIYGTFAEIGAGQETARHFFRAGGASGTIAKAMSAYDKKFSDAIYGIEENGRYVTQARLGKMLDHEMELVEERIGRENTGLPPAELTVFEYHKRGNTTHLVVRSNLLVFVHINFNNRCRIADSLFQFIQRWRLHFAGSTPICVKIHQHRLVLLDNFLKSHSLSCYWFILKQK